MILKEILFVGLCAVLLFLPLPFGADIPWAVFVFEVATFILAALHIAGGLKDANSRWPTFLKVLLLTFAAITVFQLIPLPPAVLRVLSPRAAALLETLGMKGPRSLTFAVTQSLGDGVLYAAYAIFAFLVYRHVGTRKRAEIFTLVLIASAVFQSFYGLAELFGGTQNIFRFQRTYYLGSATGTYINRDHFSGFLEMLLPLALGYLLAKADFFKLKKGLSLREKLVWFGQERLQKTLVFGLLAVIIGLGIVFSHSRTGLIIFVFTIFLMSSVLTITKRGRSGIKIVRGIAIAVIFAAIFIGIGPLIERFTSQNLTKDDRWMYYGNTLKYVQDFPLLGTGLGTFAAIYPMYETKYNPGLVDHAHNDYLEILAESGILGGGALILFAFGGVVWISSKWVKRRDPFVRGIVLGALAGVLALLIHSFFDFNLRIPANAAYFVALFAFAARAVEIKNQET